MSTKIDDGGVVTFCAKGWGSKSSLPPLRPRKSKPFAGISRNFDVSQFLIKMWALSLSDFSAPGCSEGMSCRSSCLLSILVFMITIP